MPPDLSLESAAQADGAGLVAGIDEVGRGPWAGPVVAAAVVLVPAHLPAALAAGVDDSKLLPRPRRITIARALRVCPGVHFALGSASVAEIDGHGILAATFLAMGRALSALPVTPDLALVDGNRAPALPCAVRTVVRGDGISLSIAAASIIAKVARDAGMAVLARRHPGYGWERNAGYGSAEHRAALARLGPAPAHRRSFAPIRAMLGEG